MKQLAHCGAVWMRPITAVVAFGAPVTSAACAAVHGPPSGVPEHLLWHDARDDAGFCAQFMRQFAQSGAVSIIDVTSADGSAADATAPVCSAVQAVPVPEGAVAGAGAVPPPPLAHAIAQLVESGAEAHFMMH